MIQDWEARRLLKLVQEAMHLAEHGERAPGGDETWSAWHRRARVELERLYGLNDDREETA